jgi:peptide chain release factor 2
MLRVSEIEHLSAESEFWNDQVKAQGMLKEKSQHEQTISMYQRQSRALDDAGAAVELAAEADDESLRAEASAELAQVGSGIRQLELARMLSDPKDKNDAILEFNAGAGGVESMDWAQMLYRMYVRYCERRGWKVEEADYQPGEEAGIKSASMIVRGENAYGYLKGEGGVHRLVRISPFDSNARRHTSFASVWVFPDVEDNIEINVNEGDVREDVYRSSGAGGQKVNKTSSAVRLTHLPSGIVVAIQNERSQHSNRATAWKILRGRLYDLEKRKRDAERDKVEASKMDISFGSQIRNYVLAPYRLVKDLRTGIETGNTDNVLDGDIDQFVEPYLLGVRRKDRPGADDV